MREYQVSVQRKRQQTINVTHTTLLEAINLFVATYGPKGIEGIADRGVSAKEKFEIQEDQSLTFELEPVAVAPVVASGTGMSR